MLSLALKILSVPILLWVATQVSPGIHYSSLYQPLVTGLFISGVGRLAEKLLLTRGTVLISVLADVVLAAFVIYYSQYMFAGARITWSGAAITSLIIGVIEYIVHIMLVNRVQQES